MQATLHCGLAEASDKHMDRCTAERSDRQFAEAISVAGGSTVSRLGLRFDRVVVRLLDRLRCFLGAGKPEGVTVLLTLTAPIRGPGKTAAALEQEIAALLKAGGAESEWSGILYGNRAQLRVVEHATRGRPKLLGFVHNPEVDAAEILELAECWLRSSSLSGP